MFYSLYGVLLLSFSSNAATATATAAVESSHRPAVARVCVSEQHQSSFAAKNKSFEKILKKRKKKK
jgi:hypothetical protein